MRPTDDAIRAAIKTTEYGYFGEYEMSPDQFAAVEVLVAAAEALLASPTPDVPQEGEG